MRLSPKEIDKLMLHNAGFLAQKRYARGLSLNYTESIALVASQILEFIREGKSVAELMNLGKKMIGLAEVMPGVAEMIHEIQVEGTFPDGTKLVTVHEPICMEEGDPELGEKGPRAGSARQRCEYPWCPARRGAQLHCADPQNQKRGQSWGYDHDGVVRQEAGTALPKDAGRRILVVRALLQDQTAQTG